MRPGERGSLGVLTPAGIPAPPAGLRFPGDTEARHFGATSSTGGTIESAFVITPGSEYWAGSSREILLAGGLAGGIAAANVYRPGSPSLQFGLDTSRAGTPEIAKRTEPLPPGAETPDWLGPEARATSSKFAPGAPAQIPSKLPPTGGKAVVGDAKKLRAMSGGNATRERIDAKLDELRKSGAVMPEGRDAAMLRALMGIPGADIRGEHDPLTDGPWNSADVKGAGAMAAAGQAAKEKLLGTKLGEWKARSAGKEQAERLAKYLSATGGGASAAGTAGPAPATSSNAAGFGQLDSTGASTPPAGGTSSAQPSTPTDDAALFGMGGASAASSNAPQFTGATRAPAAAGRARGSGDPMSGSSALEVDDTAVGRGGRHASAGGRNRAGVDRDASRASAPASAAETSAAPDTGSGDATAAWIAPAAATSWTREARAWSREARPGTGSAESRMATEPAASPADGPDGWAIPPESTSPAAPPPLAPRRLAAHDRPLVPGGLVADPRIEASSSGVTPGAAAVHAPGLAAGAATRASPGLVRRPEGSRGSLRALPALGPATIPQAPVSTPGTGPAANANAGAADSRRSGVRQASGSQWRRALPGERQASASVLIPGQSLADMALAPADAWPPEPADILRPGAAPAARAVSPVPPIGEATARASAGAGVHPGDVAPALDRLDSTGTVRATSASGFSAGPAGVALAVTPGEAADEPDDDAFEDGPAGSVRGRGASDLTGVTAPDDGRTPRTPHLPPPQSGLDPRATIQAFRDRETTPWKDPPRGKATPDYLGRGKTLIQHPKTGIMLTVPSRDDLNWMIATATTSDGRVDLDQLSKLGAVDSGLAGAALAFDEARKLATAATSDPAQGQALFVAAETRRIADAIYRAAKAKWKAGGRKPPKPTRDRARKAAEAVISEFFQILADLDDGGAARFGPGGFSPIPIANSEIASDLPVCVPCPCRPVEEQSRPVEASGGTAGPETGPTPGAAAAGGGRGNAAASITQDPAGWAASTSAFTAATRGATAAGVSALAGPVPLDAYGATTAVGPGAVMATIGLADGRNGALVAGLTPVNAMPEEGDGAPAPRPADAGADGSAGDKPVDDKREDEELDEFIALLKSLIGDFAVNAFIRNLLRRALRAHLLRIIAMQQAMTDALREFAAREPEPSEIEESRLDIELMGVQLEVDATRLDMLRKAGEILGPLADLWDDGELAGGLVDAGLVPLLRQWEENASSVDDHMAEGAESLLLRAGKLELEDDRVYRREHRVSERIRLSEVSSRWIRKLRDYPVMRAQLGWVRRARMSLATSAELRRSVSAWERIAVPPTEWEREVAADYKQHGGLYVFSKNYLRTFFTLAPIAVGGAGALGAAAKGSKLLALVIAGGEAAATAVASSLARQWIDSPTGRMGVGLALEAGWEAYATTVTFGAALRAGVGVARGARAAIRASARARADVLASAQRGARTVSAAVLRYPSRVADALLPRLPLNRPLSTTGRLSRFFVTPTRGYALDTPVLRLLKRIPGVRELKWQQSHLVIQQQWFQSGGPNALFAAGSTEIRGLRALGQAGWNVMPLPSAINQGLAHSPWVMAGLGVVVEGATAYSTYRTARYAYDVGQSLITGDWGENAEGE